MSSYSLVVPLTALGPMSSSSLADPGLLEVFLLCLKPGPHELARWTTDVAQRLVSCEGSDEFVIIGCALGPWEFSFSGLARTL